MYFPLGNRHIYFTFNNILLFCFHDKAIHCPRSNPNFREITWNVVENMTLHEIFHVVSRFLRYSYISCYICYIMLYTRSGENVILHGMFHEVRYHVSPTFHVISRKIDFLWDSVLQSWSGKAWILIWSRRNRIRIRIQIILWIRTLVKVYYSVVALCLKNFRNLDKNIKKCFKTIF